MNESEAPSPAPQLNELQDDNNTRLDVGPSWVGLTPDQKSSGDRGSLHGQRHSKWRAATVGSAAPRRVA